MTQPAEHKAHACPTPATALPGHEWTCPVCGVEYVAVDDEAGDAATFHWERITPLDERRRRDCPTCGAYQFKSVAGIWRHWDADGQPVECPIPPQRN